MDGQSQRLQESMPSRVSRALEQEQSCQMSVRRK
jgi:hypothetical protein